MIKSVVEEFCRSIILLLDNRVTCISYIVEGFFIEVFYCSRILSFKTSIVEAACRKILFLKDLVLEECTQVASGFCSFPEA